MAELSIPPDVLALLNAISTGIASNNSIAANTGYLSPQDALFTPEGQAWGQAQIDQYRQNAGGGWNPDGTALNGSHWGLPNVAQGPSSIIAWALENNPTSFPTVPTYQSQQDARADQLARDLAETQAATQRYVTDTNAQLQRDLQAGLITHQQAMQASQEAHEKALQANELAFQYAELDWTKEFGRENLQILRDRLAWDQEYGRSQLALDDRRVSVLEGGLDLDRDKFGLEKAMQEAQMRANPFNAVANALYMRGQPATGDTNEFGAPLTTLDNSGVLPFLTQLSQGGITQPINNLGTTPLNSAGIGGNVAPRANQISQRSFGNMSQNEIGINSSLAAYGGYNPEDYWRSMQRSWNTSGQRQQTFSGGLR